MFFGLYLSPGKVAPMQHANYWSNLVHQIPITTGWTWAVWNTKLPDPALGIKPQTFWSWVQCLIHLARVIIEYWMTGNFQQLHSGRNFTDWVLACYFQRPESARKKSVPGAKPLKMVNYTYSKKSASSPNSVIITCMMMCVSCALN